MVCVLLLRGLDGQKGQEDETGLSHQAGGSGVGADIPATTPLSDRISKDLKKRGFKFVGSTIIYAYMQAIGIVNDHVKGCYLYVPE